MRIVISITDAQRNAIVAIVGLVSAMLIAAGITIGYWLGERDECAKLADWNLPPTHICRREPP